MTSFLENTAFSLGSTPFTWGALLAFFLIASLIILATYSFKKRFLPDFFAKEVVKPEDQTRLHKTIRWIVVLLILFIGLRLFNLNYPLFGSNYSWALVVQAVLLIQIARLLDWFISNVYIRNYYSKRDNLTDSSKNLQANTESNAARIVQYIVYVLAVLFVLQANNLDYELFNIETENGTGFVFKLSNILRAILVILVARLIVWVLTQIVLYSFYKRKKIDQGAQFAFNQLISYVIYFISVVYAISILGMNMTLFWGGAAALLVGIGLGLQQTFNDFFSGIVLLFEQRVKIGDVLEFNNGIIGIVRNIGLRSSIVETRENVSHIVPNSVLVNNDVINWTHFDEKVRFNINVGVAYGSDTALVKRLLLQTILKNPYIIEYPAPFVRMVNFGDNSLDFVLYFFSTNYIVIEDIKSDIRMEIDRLFRENNISIPFPQRDVWIKKES